MSEDAGHPDDGDVRVSLQTHADADRWAQAAAADIAAAITAELRTQPSATVLLSGGTSPVPVYRRLAGAALDWSRVEIGLVDERWGAPGHAGSNAILLRESLLQASTAAARFTPLIRPGLTLEAAVSAANAHATAMPMPCMAVLGMGEDGHVASLFPGAAGLLDAYADPRPYIALDATGCPVAGAWTQRITLTPAGLMWARARLLLIRGATKLAVFRRALASHDPLHYPVRVAITAPGASLRVHWCP